MSTKTISKRVALATVVALGAGVLSLVSVSSASATAGGNLAAGSTQTSDAAYGTLNIATASSVTGTATPSATLASNTSVGLLSVSDIAGGLVAGTTQTATLLSTGTLTVYSKTGGTAFNTGSVVVTGGHIVNTNLDTTNTPTQALNSSGTVYTAQQSATQAGQAFAVSIQPNSGVSSFTVALYTQTGSATLTAAAINGNPTAGTLAGYINVSIASASTAGTVSVTNSGVYFNAPSSTTAVTSNSTVSGTGTSAYNIAQNASIVIKDAYGSHLAAGTLVTATATNGAYVGLSANGSTMSTAPGSAGTLSSSFTTTNGTADASGNVGMTVGDPSNAPLTTVVTVQVGGVTVGTKAFTFTGKVAKVTLAGSGNGLTTDTGTGSNAGNLLSVSYQDSAGNVVYPGYVAGSNANTNSTSYPQTNLKDAGISGLGVAVGTSTYPTPTATGTVGFSCGALNSTGQFLIDYVNADGSTVVSNTIPVSCSGAAYSYTAALDKSTYAPGDVATLTVTFKDSSGALAADKYATSANTTLSGTVQSSAITGISGGTGGTAPKVTASQLTATSGVTTAGATTDVTTDGVIKYVFIVGTTTGAYQAIVDFGQVDAAGIGAPQTVAYKVADGSTSLNDVLKGIVSLIASINKQIAALAKLVTKK